MTISAWRIFKSKHRNTAFSGDGARLYGGRWNSRGTAVVYLAESISLAALEMLVHLDNHQVLAHYLVAEVQIDEHMVIEITFDRLPQNWRESPPPSELQSLGDAWVDANESAVLCLPSSVIENESLYVLNPNHPDYGTINILEQSTFQFDPRLLDSN